MLKIRDKGMIYRQIDFAIFVRVSFSDTSHIYAKCPENKTLAKFFEFTEVFIGPDEQKFWA